ncbi:MULTISPECIES: acyl carrier protein [unclassified Pseudomonas]|uniref:acyl carrier protein n=1 Tax=unclassified Pseudomonas TaxID=196821 RepID=UPI00244A36D4|nr:MULTISPECIES: acyl carrier protein [unclassified Pseudomonas]MDH0302046.1 acyl carrier protein [Pseudomonas sp. GD04091]MDH1984119.1 acyl carrier protein [Pseudomonas sp. GD03689]
MDYLEERLITLITEQLSIEKTYVIPTANFETDLGADNLDIIGIVMATEKEFDITLDGDQAEKVKTVNDLLVLVRKASPK